MRQGDSGGRVLGLLVSLDGVAFAGPPETSRSQPGGCLSYTGTSAVAFDCRSIHCLARLLGINFAVAAELELQFR